MLKIKKLGVVLVSALMFSVVLIGAGLKSNKIKGYSVENYYVSQTGSDSNLGTINKPFKTIAKAVSVAAQGQTIYLRGGTYISSSEIDLNKSGSKDKYIILQAYLNEKPIIDFSSETAGKQGFNISGSYWYLRNIEIKNAGHHGVHVTGSNNIFEDVVSHNNRDSGFFVGLNKTTPNDGTKAANNSFINCDSYLNVDIGGSTGDGGNADGFSCKLNPGAGNYFYGCRSYENSDDGWDCYMSNYPITIKNCYTWHNGDPKSYNYSGRNWGGNGNGFKMGGNYNHGKHLLENCIAFDMNYGKAGHHKAFDQNNNMSGVTMYNCMAFNSETGFSFGAVTGDSSQTVLKNCVSFGNKINTSLARSAVQANNNWNLGINVSNSDFVSLSVMLIRGQRNSDGSLNIVGFAKLTKTSRLINKGVDVGIPYLGKAPDVGAIESY